MTLEESLSLKMRKMHYNMMLSVLEEDKFSLICKSNIKEKLRLDIKKLLLNIRVWSENLSY